MASDQVIADYARAVVLNTAGWAAAERAEIAKHEADGYLIVNVEQERGSDDELVAWLECWRTGRRLGDFDGTDESWAAAERAEGREFWNRDRIAEDWDYEVPLPPGFPPGLVDGIAEWVNHEDNADEVAAFTGMDAAEVRRSVASVTPENTPRAES